ncbi:hypothetical protein BASA60_000537 [Batrachochytrium salamandrivorans]|nr:hypothetical protein BASA60_000537 [Batrachochytrium salamandrivorans]
MDVLWKRADEKQTGPVPSSSRSGASTEASTEASTGASAGSSAVLVLKLVLASGGNSGLSKMGQLRDYIEKLYKNHKAKTEHSKAEAALKKDEKSIKNAIKKLTRITGGVSKDQRSLHKEMVKIQNTGKKSARKHLGHVLQSINDIIKNPQRVIEELEEIVDSIKAMYMALKLVTVRRYKDLVQKWDVKEMRRISK